MVSFRPTSRSPAERASRFTLPSHKKGLNDLAEVDWATIALKSALPHPAEDPIILRPIALDVLETPCFESCTWEVDGDARSGMARGVGAYPAPAQEAL